ncbi:DUF4365 domain-containing protein [Persicimonas caeni]|uniref:DUF4365 domain-containing protein n=1 Tax=Persicimonas caeni TaxID=2292766 RepID=UPI00143CD75E|nr:DUF4365 domain-containing protein [Persicimonas caeni]
MSTNDIKEELSYAYVHAVASKTAFSCDRVSKDRDSIDVTIRAKGKLAEDSKVYSPVLDLQLKATSNATIREGQVVFDLKMKNYDELRERSQTPRLLVVLVLPANEDEWLEFGAEQLVARRCCYWYSLRGAEEVDNETSRRIEIPQVQVFSPEQLRALMVKASRYEEIGNEL